MHRPPLFPWAMIAIAVGTLSACSHVPQSSGIDHPVVSQVEKYVVSVPVSLQLPYEGAYVAEFGKTLPFAPGSGLAYRGKDAAGRLLFYGIGDRGPNGDSPKVVAGGKESASKVFPIPEFVPRFGEIIVTPGKQAELVRTVPIGFANGPSSGLPVPPGKTGNTGEVALTDRLASLPFDANGIDPESIAIDADGHLWVSDEYGPFLMKLDRHGTVLAKYEPGKGLPAVIAQRQPNRGFEGATVTPSGKVVAVVQSTLDIDGKTKDRALFTRIVELDPKTGKTRQFAYRVDAEHYRKPGDAKLGDIVAIDDNRFALIDQGAGQSGMRNLIVLIDVSEATDISDRKTAQGQELEYASADELSTIHFVRQSPLADLRTLGWIAEKAEGLALVDGRLAVINDNDFGISSTVAGDKGEKMSAYTVRDGKLSENGRYRLQPNGEPTQLWIITLRKPIASYLP